MNLENSYYYFESALPHRVCDDIMRHGKGRKTEKAITGHNVDEEAKNKLTKEQIKNIQKKRKSDIVWLSDTWIYKEIHPFVQQANRLAGWNFDWDYSENCQFTKYGVGQYYGWHCDSFPKPYDEPDDINSHGKIRKLSVTISLTDPNEYEGGNLEFDFRNQVDWENNKKQDIKECTEIRPKGSIIVFPSFVWHRVSPVTKGTRYSLVMWSLGKPFR